MPLRNNRSDEMASVPIQIDGTFYPHARGGVPSQPVKGTMLGHASIYGLGIGGGPIQPPDGGNGGGGGEPVFPAHPIVHPPGIWGPTDPRPSHPIVIPLPPETPGLPPPGSPPVHIGNTQPVNPMQPPAAVMIEYPGLGKVVVPQPTQSVQIPVPAPSPAQPGATPA
jgi:hypothetical protein